MTATVTPTDAAAQVSFDTDDNTIATVSGSTPTLTVTGVANGTTEVTASVAGEVIAIATVNVGSLTVTLSPSPVVVAVNDSASLAVIVSPASEAGEVTFDTADSTIATVPSSPPAWDDDEALLPVSGVAQGTTQVRAWAAGVVVAVAAVNVTPPPSVTITTQTDRELIQDPSTTLNSITLNAQITPTTDTIVWTLSGPGYDPNGTGNKWVTYSPGSQSNGIGSITITLDKNSGTWSEWDKDSSVTVTAASQANPNLQSQMTIPLTKFRRNSQRAGGSQPITVTIRRRWSDDPIGWTLDLVSGTSNFYGQILSAPPGWNGGPTGAARLMDRTGSDEQPEFGSGNYNVYYYMSNDKGDGSYSYRDTLTTSGYYYYHGYYDTWNIFRDANIAMGTARTAAVDNEAVNVTDTAVAANYNGTPATLTFSITGIAMTTGAGGTGGVSVPCQIRGQNDISRSNMSVKDSYILTFSGTNTVGTQIQLTKLLRVASSAIVQQLNDGEWDLQADCAQAWRVPQITSLTFQPSF